MELQTTELIPFNETCQQKPPINWDAFTPARPHTLGVDQFDISDLAIIRTYLDWQSFFHKWGSPLPFPDVLAHLGTGEPARQFSRKINAYLDRMLAEKVFEMASKPALKRNSGY